MSFVYFAAQLRPRAEPQFYSCSCHSHLWVRSDHTLSKRDLAIPSCRSCHCSFHPFHIVLFLRYHHTCNSGLWRETHNSFSGDSQCTFLEWSSLTFLRKGCEKRRSGSYIPPTITQTGNTKTIKHIEDEQRHPDRRPRWRTFASSRGLPVRIFIPHSPFPRIMPHSFSLESG